MENELKGIIKNTKGKNKKLKEIYNFLDSRGYNYVIIKSNNGYNIIEIFEVAFIIETLKSYKIVII